MKLSLAICTYNRSELLGQALRSLASCEKPPVDWELLLIDNNSGDETSEVAERFSQRLPIRYFFEPRQGLSEARNRALQESRGDTILFTDDDLEFDEEWLATYMYAFSGRHSAGWFGGRVLPLWRGNRPGWLHDESLALISGLLVRYDLGGEDRPYAAEDPSPFGASFALRRSAIERIGEFRTDLGVCGRKTGRGEEADYIRRARESDIPGFYVGSSCAWHQQDPKRFWWGYLYRYGIQKGIAETRMKQQAPKGTFSRQLLYAARCLWQIGQGRGDRARQCVINMGIQHGLRQRS